MSKKKPHDPVASLKKAFRQTVEDPELHERWVRFQRDLERAERGLRIWKDEHGKPTWVEHPDWHSHSWMTIEELEEAFSRYQVHATQEWGEQINRAPLEYRAMLAAMKELEDGGKNEVRVVFWFDN